MRGLGEQVGVGGLAVRICSTATPGLGPCLSLQRSSSIMASQVSQLLRDLSRFLTPTIPVLDDEYDGLEYSWKIFVFRPAREYSNPFIIRFRAISSMHTHTHFYIPL